MCYFQWIYIVKMEAEVLTLHKDILFKRLNNYQWNFKLTSEMSLPKLLYTTLSHGTIIQTGIKNM